MPAKKQSVHVFSIATTAAYRMDHNNSNTS